MTNSNRGMRKGKAKDADRMIFQRERVEVPRQRLSICK